ncbi:phosphatase 2C-like domain-containing protein [Mycotypha africana]|uniref:phosphatase 2C-like domain-containing protein n=1 Tax=Mycotypha africana TaxID=64632 RepID=UPI0023007ADD|nr:phosphatase 2C-like domain-containing protein [Mycotypha africana]KAI8975581.1 phosphatase 2C-like domain-containing protein [Mycotypha africana]
MKSSKAWPKISSAARHVAQQCQHHHQQHTHQHLVVNQHSISLATIRPHNLLLQHQLSATTSSVSSSSNKNEIATNNNQHSTSTSILPSYSFYKQPFIVQSFHSSPPSISPTKHRHHRQFSTAPACANAAVALRHQINCNSNKESKQTQQHQPDDPHLYIHQQHRNNTNATTLSPHKSTLPSLIDFFAKTYAKQAPSYIFCHAASGFAKQRRTTAYLTPEQRHILQQQQKHYLSVQIGDDAYFRRSDAIGVADGVGGWAGVSSAANAALYSRKLMHHAYMELERFDNMEDYPDYYYNYDEYADPIRILQKSYEYSNDEARKEGILGSCTACLAILRHAELRIANLGDCGISVIRQNDYIFRSEEQQHAFNFPYQLGTSSPDQPKDAQTFTVAVEKGDIIIMGSDGLFDNLFDGEILSIVKRQVATYTIPGRPSRLLSLEPQVISDALAEQARIVSLSKMNVDSPFQERANHEGIYYQGGKADDISVIVAIVKDCEDSPDRRL